MRSFQTEPDLDPAPAHHSFQAADSDRAPRIEISGPTESHSNTPAKRSKPQQFTLRVMKDHAADARLARLREQEEREEQEQQELLRIKEIMTKESSLRIRCSGISKRAQVVRRMSSQTRQDVGSLIQEYDEELISFNEFMSKAYESEVARLEAEKLYKEFLATNAGRPKGYFQVPSFLTKKQSLKRRVKDIKMDKERGWNKSLKIAKPHP